MNEQKDIVVLGDKNCLGYAISKAFSLFPKYHVYTKVQQNLKDELTSIKQSEINNIEKIFYCNELFDLNARSIRGIDTDNVLDFILSIEAEEIVFFETYTFQKDIGCKCNDDLLEFKKNIKKQLNNKIKDTWIRIPQVYGIFQESNNIIPRLILNPDEYKLSYGADDIISLIYSMDIADFLVNEEGIDLEKRIISIDYHNLIKVIECLKLSNYNDLQNCWIYLENGQRIYLNLENMIIRKFIYSILEVIEYYEINKSFYFKFL